MDILNFISWIKGSRVVTSVDPAKTLIPVGLKDNRRDDGYLAGAISVADLTSSIVNDRLIAGTKEVVLTDTLGDATLTFSPGNAVIETSSPGSDLFIRTLVGDDIFIQSGDDITLRGDQGLFDDEAEGGDINIYAGDGSDGNTNDAGSGGDIRIEAGNAGNSVSGLQGEGGFVTIQAGYTTATGLSGGDISLEPGNSVDGISGDVIISGNVTWTFDTNKATLRFTSVVLSTLPNAVGASGSRAMIKDSSVTASGNFGVIAVGGGMNIVPVFSDGINWLIG